MAHSKASPPGRSAARGAPHALQRAAKTGRQSAGALVTSTSMAGAALVLVLVGCSATAGPEAAPRAQAPEPRSTATLALDFEDRAAALGTVIPGADNAGTAAINSRVVTAAGGRIRREVGIGGGYAVRFPRFTGRGPTAAAVLLVHARGADFLAPGNRDFRFGLDFRLDEESWGSETDNGDNLLQRGLFSDPEQYKIQVDRGVPSCRVKGRRGEALVRGERTIEAGVWHRISCTRRADRLTLVVRVRSGARWRPWETARVKAVAGALHFRGVSPPLAVGGKVDADGVVAISSTDQFNGTVDNVRFDFVD